MFNPHNAHQIAFFIKCILCTITFSVSINFFIEMSNINFSYHLMGRFIILCVMCNYNIMCNAIIEV